MNRIPRSLARTNRKRASPPPAEVQIRDEHCKHREGGPLFIKKVLIGSGDVLHDKINTSYRRRIFITLSACLCLAFLSKYWYPSSRYTQDRPMHFEIPVNPSSKEITSRRTFVYTSLPASRSVKSCDNCVSWTHLCMLRVLS